VTELTGALLYIALAALLLAGGIGLGMLIAPRIMRRLDRDEEGTGDDD
jgi:hypothetical protein